jgi:UDP-glucose 4-epimerase
VKKALVFGGNGFIGSHLVDSLLEKRWDVTVIDKRARKYGADPGGVHFSQLTVDRSSPETENYLAASSPDVVFNLAWETLPETSLRNPTRDIVNNLVPALHIINACTRAKVKLIFVSSGGAVYGNVQEPRITEADETNPISPYGIEKLMAEKYLFMYRSLYGLDYTTIRPSTPFGPRQDYLGKQGAVAVFLYRVARGLPVPVWGDGTVVRDYFYVADLVDALIKCADHPGQDGSRVFNVGGGTGISLIQLLESIQQTVGKTAVIERLPARKFDPEMIVLDTSLILNRLGWTPKVPLLEGIGRTWDWMKKVL